MKTSIRLNSSYILIFIFSASLVFATIMNMLDIVDTLKFTIYSFLFLLMPSWALGRIIFRNAPWSNLARTTVAYPLVIAIHIIIGIITVIAHTGWLIYILPVISLLLILANLKKENQLNATKIDIIFGVTIFIYLTWICLFWFFLWSVYPIPSEPVPTQMHQDHLWNAGNVWAVVRQTWPLQDPRALGQPLTYHLAQSVIHAGAYIVTGVHPYFLQNYYFPTLDAMVLIVTVIYCGKEVAGLKTKISIWLALTLFFTSGFGWYYNGHLFWNPLTFFYSLAPFTLWLFMIKAYFDGDIQLNKVYLITLYFTMVSIKSLLALIVLPSLGLVIGISILRGQRQDYLSKLLLIFGMLMTTLAIKEVFFRYGQRGVHIGTKIAESRMYQLISQFTDDSNSILVEILFGIYLVVTRTPILIINAAGISIIYIFISKYIECNKNWKSFNNGLTKCFQSYWFLLLIAIILTATIERYFIQYEEYAAGASIYFEWYPMWIVPFLAAYIIDQCNPSPKHWIAIWVIFLLGALWTSYSIGLIPVEKNIQTETQVIDKKSTISVEEWEALEWLRVNTPINAIVASDRRSFRGNGKSREQSRFFAYSALSGRQILLEGEDYLGGEARANSIAAWSRLEKQIANNDNISLCKDLSLSDAQYFLQSLRFNQLELNNCPQMKEIFRNRDTIIYWIWKKQ